MLIINNVKMPRKSKDKKKLSIYTNSNTIELKATILRELGFPRYWISFKNPFNNDKPIETSAIFRVKHIEGAKSRKKIPKGIKQQLINSTCIIQLDKANRDPFLSIEIVGLCNNDKMLDEYTEESHDINDIIFSNLPNSDEKDDEKDSDKENSDKENSDYDTY
jgi:hypothetical protein